MTSYASHITYPATHLLVIGARRNTTNTTSNRVTVHAVLQLPLCKICRVKRLIKTNTTIVILVSPQTFALSV